MIKINLYDYQRIAQEVTIQKMVMTAVLIVFVALGLTGLSYVNDTVRVSNAQAEVVEAQQKVNQIKPQYDVVQKLRTREEGLKKKIQGLEGLRSAKVPFARLLEDVGRVAPEGVWLKKVEQENEKKLRGMRVPILFLDKAPKGKKAGKVADADQHLFIKFEGMARSDRGVVRFMEAMESLDYLDHVMMHKSTLGWIGKRKVRNYTVYAHVVGSGPKK